MHTTHIAPVKAHPDPDATQVATAWFSRLSAMPHAARPHAERLPARPLATLAAFVTIALTEGRTLLILVPDDDILPGLSNQLDISIRPLCLVLPAADFAAQVALRATISLLKSRLWRNGEEEQSATWTRQRERIENYAALWQETQTWAAKNDRSDAPLAIGKLFPVQILPISAYRKLQHQTADITLLYRCDTPPELIAPAGGMLRIGTPAASRHRTLVVDDANTRLLQERAQLMQSIADLELELATVQAEVAEFTQQYHTRVGRRMAEFDALQAQQAQTAAQRAPDNPQARADARQKQRQAEQSAQESQRFNTANGEGVPPFRPSNEIKRQFRQLAQQIHPDRATDDADRAWRTQLMSEANRAYRHGDSGALSEIASLWAESHRPLNTAKATKTAAMPNAAVSPAPTLQAEVERLRTRLTEIERELHRIFGSRLYELFVTARQAARQGRDLLHEMAEQLDASIAQLHERCRAAA